VLLVKRLDVGVVILRSLDLMHRFSRLQYGRYRGIARRRVLKRGDDLPIPIADDMDFHSSCS